MQVRSISPDAGIHVRSGDAVVAAAALIGCIGDAEFGQRAIEQLTRFLPLCHWTVYGLPTGSLPRLHLGGCLGDPRVIAQAWRAYSSGLYRRDTTFEAARSALQTSQQVMTHLHSLEVQPAHRQQIYVEHGLAERVSLVRRESEDEMLCVNFYRHESQRSFSDNELDDIQQLGAWMLSCVTRHLQIGRTGETALVLDVLPRREREVCDRLLRGLSHDGVAADLGLSVTTVRTYRDRAFERLGIHHRSELFALAFAARLQG